MKKFVILISILFLVPMCAIAQAGLNDGDKKPIIMNPGDIGNVTVFRSPFVVPFECYYLIESGSILIKSTSEVSIFQVEILNLATGYVISKEVYSASGSNLISLMNLPGFYQLNLVLKTGEVFTGYFEVD